MVGNYVKKDCEFLEEEDENKINVRNYKIQTSRLDEGYERDLNVYHS